MTPEAASAFRDLLIPTLEAEHRSFLQVAGAMPDDQLGYRPEDRLMGFGALCLHIAGSGMFFTSIIRDGKMPEMGESPSPEVPTTAAALVAACDGMLQGALEAYRGFDAAALAREIDFAGMGTHPGVTYVHWHLLHLVHHRGQLTTYLRVAGQRVPSVYGPTADVSFQDMMAGQQ